MMMGNERASVMMKQMVAEHERQSKLSGLMSKAGSSVTAQLKIKGELDAICEILQQGEDDVESSKGGGLAVLKGTMQAAGLAGSMTSAFAAIPGKKHEERKAGLKKGLRASVMGAGQVMGLKTQAAHAHARDFSIKKWHKHTRGLSGKPLYDALYPPVAEFPCEAYMKLSSMNKLVAKIYEAYCCEFFQQDSHASKRGKARTRPPLHECLLRGIYTSSKSSKPAWL